MNNLNTKYLIVNIILFLLIAIFVIPNLVFAQEVPYNSIDDCATGIPNYSDLASIKCFAYFAHQSKDVNICIDQYRNTYSQEQNISNCLNAYAVWEKDAKVCDTIEQYVGIDNAKTYYREGCLYQVALATRNDSLCSSLSDTSRLPPALSDRVLCKNSIKKLQSYYLYIPVLIILFVVSLIFLFFFKKNTKIRLLIVTLISLVPPILVIPVGQFIKFLKDWDFFFQFNTSSQYLNTLQKYLSDSSFVYVFAFLIFIYLPIATLINTYQIYKQNNPKWWQFLLIFFAIHIFGIIAVTLATFGYGIGIALPLSGISTMITLVIFFTFIFIHKHSRQV